MAEGAQEGAEPEGPVPPRRKAPPSPPAPLSKAARIFADKARDLDALRATVVDAAGVGAGLWFSYLFVLLYLFVAAGSVTHKDLFLESPIRLPFLNIELPLLGFFVLGPFLFLVVHGYVLLHFMLLAGKVGAFHAELKQLNASPEIHEDLRRQLPSNLFVQILAGPREVRRGSVGLLMRLVAQFSLVFGPVALLAFFLLQFLPYHHESITWWHRIALVVDLALLWLLWPSVAEGRIVRVHDLWGRQGLSMAVISAIFLVSAFTVATSPGESLYAWRSLIQLPEGRDDKGRWIWFSLHDWLIDGGLDEDNQARKSVWSNRLVLPAINIESKYKIETTNNITVPQNTLSLRARDLRGAVMIGAVIGRTDLTAARIQDISLDQAQLQGALLDRAQLQRASLRSAQLQGASFRGAQLQGASLDGAQLQGASLDGAQLQGASLRGAQLQGASLRGAQLQGASLRGAQLQGASLDGAQLQGASLDGAQLQGASLDGAQLQGASLDRAQLQGASLDGAQLQGASLDGAQLQGASLINVRLQGASLSHANLQGASVRMTSLQGVSFFQARLQGASFIDSAVWRSTLYDYYADGSPRVIRSRNHAVELHNFEIISTKLRDEIPEGKQKTDAMIRISTINPITVFDEYNFTGKFWLSVENSPPSIEYFMNSVANIWKYIACDPSGSPYVAKMLTRRLSGKDIYYLFATNSDSDFIYMKKYFGFIVDGLLESSCIGARGLAEVERELLKSRPWDKVEPWRTEPEP